MGCENGTDRRLPVKMYLGLIGLGAPALALGVGAVFGTASAHADTVVYDGPLGEACQNCALTVTSADNAKLQTKEFTSKDGTVRTRTAGKGPDLTFFNPDAPSTTYTLKGNGATSRTASGPDGTSTLTVTGHNVLIYFPTDTLLDGEPGPATQLVTGRAVINIDENGNWTTESQSGRVTDICAELPPS
jgi:hypothetical protein